MSGIFDGVLPFMLGGNVFGWTADREASFAVLDRFLEAGGSAIDTADVYSAWLPGHQGGESEAMIGEWFKARGTRGKVLLATKVGMLAGEGGAGLKASRILAACDASLKRLNTDYIDLYFAHKDDAATPMEESLEAFDLLVKAGKVRALGASNYSAERLTQARAISAANGWVAFTTLEPEYNLLGRAGYEGSLQTLCVDQDIAVTPYFGLAAGYLTGKYRVAADIKGGRASWAKTHMEANGPKVLAAMDEVAAQTGATLAAIALAWLAAQPGVTAPIASATSVAQLDQLLAFTQLKLTADQIAALDAASAT
jgi:aryl-alcohol dehydrogenase-like predicted oxidoreductase